MADVMQGDEAGLEDDTSPEEGLVDPEEGGEAEVGGGGEEEEEEDVDGLASFLESEILSGSSADDPVDVSSLCLSSPLIVAHESNLFTFGNSVAESELIDARSSRRRKVMLRRISGSRTRDRTEMVAAAAAAMGSRTRG